MKINRKTALALCTVFLTVLFATAAFAVKTAPVNPEFLKYKATLQSKVSGHPTGLRPSPLKLSHVAPPKISGLKSKAALPSSFSLVDSGYVTSVRDQDPYGTCWAFASFGSIESELLMAKTDTYDLSEWHLAYFAYQDESTSLPAFTQSELGPGYDPIYDQGGNIWIAAAILARRTGAVAEAVRPYGGDNPQPGDAVSVRLQDIYYMGERNEVTASSIKNALTEYGAIYISVPWKSSFYSSTNFSYYIPLEILKDGNHAVTVVGWDDSYSKDNFTSKPSSDGAWLVKNSWGTTWGDSGYFWISYENLINEAAAYSGCKEKYDRAYQYDPLGWISCAGYSASETSDTKTAWMANIFTANGPYTTGEQTVSEMLKAISFYTPDDGCTYLAEIRTGVTAGNPRSGSIAATTTGTLAAAGYHTISISSVKLIKGEKFSVIVRITTSDYENPIAIEKADTEYSDKASAEAGQSYISADGDTWDDATVKVDSTANVCLKAFTADTIPGQPSLVSPTIGACDISLTSTLTASDFSSKTGAAHSSTQWEIATTEDFSSGMILNEESSESLTSFTVESGLLSRGTTYYWRVRYKDSEGIYSAWSAVSSFTTTSSGSGGGGGGCNTGLPAVSLIMILAVFAVSKRSRQ